MLIISQNAINYELGIPKDTVLRINLAWCNSISELENILKTHPDNKIFVDLQIGRIKPQINRYAKLLMPIGKPTTTSLIKPAIKMNP